MQSKIIILGAGLTGLTLGYLLEQAGLEFIILEARPRPGGRIRTIAHEKGTLEMGATWFGNKHRHLTTLLNELNLDRFPQHAAGLSLFETFSFAPPQSFHMPDSEEETSYRICEGTDSVIRALTRKIPEQSILYNTPAKSVFFSQNHIILTCEEGKAFSCDRLISTLPPRLLATAIRFEPGLPEELLSTCLNTHTWMGESIKFSLVYDQPFWRDLGYSGTAYSQSGISPEMYDHSSPDGHFHALKGFLNPGSAQMSQEERRKLLLNQLNKYYGEVVHQYTAYHESIWSFKKYTFHPYHSYIRAHQNNGHPVFRKMYFDGRFRVAGSETAVDFPGYMDGAVCSAREAFQSLLVD